MKILLICPFFPYPPNTGIRIREYNIIKQLSKKHLIALCSFVQSEKEVRFIKELKSFCFEIIPIRHKFELGRRRWYHVPLGFFWPNAICFFGRGTKELFEVILKLIKKYHFDCIIVDTLYMARYVSDIKNISKFLVEHNIETIVQRRIFLHTKSLIMKLRKYLYWKSFEKFEAKTCEQFLGCIVVSNEDKKFLLKISPRISNLEVIPNGVDTSFCSFSFNLKENNNLIFTGALTYSANFDAMQYFLKEIYYLIKKEIPNIKLKITGGTRGVNINKLKLDESVKLTGYVDDVRPLIKNSAVCIVPLRIGGGTRVKILEAMALGTPVVSTSIGAEGIEGLRPVIRGSWLVARDTNNETRYTKNDFNIWIADTPEDFAEAVVTLLEDENLAEALGKNARRYVEENHNWDEKAKQLEEIYEKAMQNK
jgi:glycosyltransferase involved in cell wall biosynthesis